MRKSIAWKSDAGDRDIAQTYSKLKECGVVRDAANVFGRVLSYIRDEDFLGGNKINGYTAVVSDRPESNPAVRIARGEVFFDGQPCQKLLERLRESRRLHAHRRGSRFLEECRNTGVAVG